MHEQAAARSLKTIDATCPLVTKVHHEVRRFANEETEILLIGHEGHEEVEGTAGEAVGKVKIVDGLDGARTVQPTPGKKLVWLSQTTLSVDETLEAVAILRQRFPEFKIHHQMTFVMQPRIVKKQLRRLLPKQISFS